MQGQKKSRKSDELWREAPVNWLSALYESSPSRRERLERLMPDRRIPELITIALKKLRRTTSSRWTWTREHLKSCAKRRCRSAG